MDKTTYRSTALVMLELVRCAVTGKTPEKQEFQPEELENLFKVCQNHILTACIAYVLESAGIHHHQFTQAKEKAIRKNIILETECNKIFAQLEQHQIWYIPLKGALLKNWYPKLGMRQMSDHDILCDNSKRSKIKEIMLNLGFTCEHFGVGNNDAYFKPPVCNFEMHSELFALTQIGKLHSYYSNIKEKLIKDENNQYGYHFRTEDFYIYFMAHEYKHYATGGIGVRTLLDTYIFMKKFGNTLDWDYLRTELEELEIADYEQQSRTLAMKYFQFESLTTEEQEQLDYYIFSNSYGTIENQVKNESSSSKTKYILHRIFPSMDHYKTWYPWAYRHKILIPAAWLFRPVRGILCRRKKLCTELHYLAKKGEDKK